MCLLIRNKNKSFNFCVQGFTLVEVMITLVILAILSSLAIPWYGDYTRKTYVAESINLASSARVQTTEMIAVGTITSEGVPVARQWGQIQAGPDGVVSLPVDTNKEIFVQSPSPYIDKIVRVGSLVIVDYTTKMDPQGQTKYALVYYSSFSGNSGGIQWKCLVGDTAVEYLVQAREHYSSLGIVPLPTRWAPKNCSSSLYEIQYGSDGSSYVPKL